MAVIVMNASQLMASHFVTRPRRRSFFFFDRHQGLRGRQKRPP